MQFLAPAWLFALGALAVPIALHLWSRRGGTPVRIGSIRLLVGSPPAVRRAWRFQEPWLLLLRCAMLATLVLALAAPVRRKRSQPGTWALVSGDLTATADSALIDSLTGAGVAVRRLDPGNLWVALRDADREAAPGTRFVVFAPDFLRYVYGERPALRAPVEWRVRTPPPPAHPASGLQREARLVALYADAERSDDARYVTAAIHAAAGATGIPVDIAIRGDPAAAEWIVWLSVQPVPEAVLSRVRAGATLIQDGGAAHPSRGRSNRGDREDRIVFVRQAAARPEVRQVNGLDLQFAGPVAPPDSAAPVWTDGAGRPLLTVTRMGGGIDYRFHGRFHPSSSDLVLTPEFPYAFATLWAAPAALPDDRRIAVSQLLPAREVATPPPPTETPRSWFTALWFLAVLLFALERWLSR